MFRGWQIQRRRSLVPNLNLLSCQSTLKLLRLGILQQYFGHHHEGVLRRDSMYLLQDEELWNFSETLSFFFSSMYRLHIL